ncbi:MAG TPA: hypothetical protein PKE55_03055 [Kiritimatiellia bacterium]|nr:hypothetical protein [Kiritimatiellia bacterium]
MTAWKDHPILPALIAGLLGLAAVITTLSAVRSDVETRDVIARRTATLRELEARHAARLADQQRIRDYIQAWSGGDLPTSLRSLLDGVAYEVDLRDSSALLDGWALRRYDVVLPEVPLGRLGDVLEALENRRPSRRVREVQILPSPTRNRGRATLMIETIEPVGREVRP